MKIALFNSKPYDESFFLRENERFGHELSFFEPQLNEDTVRLAEGFPGVCVFVNDPVDASVLEKLAAGGARLIALRCSGFNNVDLQAAAAKRITVVRVPAYSPHAVAEHAVALLLAMNRKTHRAYNRVREGNFALDGLLGFDLYGKTVGVIGTGRIGAIFARIMKGFGCELLAHDKYPSQACREEGVVYVEKDELLQRSDIVSLHCPLTVETRHIIDANALSLMRQGVTLINTSRGGLVDTIAVIKGLKSGKIGYLGLDVYEEEEELFFKDLSDEVIQDDIFARLLTFPNVLITGHQAYFTGTALSNIAQTTLQNVADFENTGQCENAVTL